MEDRENRVPAAGGSGRGDEAAYPERPEDAEFLRTLTLNEAEIRDVMNRLADAYPDAGCALHFRTPFQLLVAVVLSAQTTDKKVNQVTPSLFERCPTAFEMASLTEVELQDAIRTIGLYRNKAKNLIGLSRMLVEKYDGEVPEDQKLLEELPGVGRKSANVVMAEAFGHQRIAVDTHVFRVSSRIGLVCEKNVLDTEKALMRVLPEDRWTEMHHTIIFHGRQVCHARKPACGECVLSGLCLQRI